MLFVVEVGEDLSAAFVNPAASQQTRPHCLNIFRILLLKAGFFGLN